MVSYAASMARGRMSCQSFAIGSNPIIPIDHFAKAMNGKQSAVTECIVPVEFAVHVLACFPFLEFFERLLEMNLPCANFSIESVSRRTRRVVSK